MHEVHRFEAEGLKVLIQRPRCFHVEPAVVVLFDGPDVETGDYHNETEEVSGVSRQENRTQRKQHDDLLSIDGAP